MQFKPVNDVQRALHVLEENGQYVATTTRAAAVAGSVRLFDEFQLAEADARASDPKVLARQLTDALGRGARVLLEHDGSAPGLELGKTWCVFLGANNALVAQQGGPANVGTTSWTRVRELDVEALGRHGGRFAVLQHKRADHPRALDPPVDAGRPGPVYGEPSAKRLSDGDGYYRAPFNRANALAAFEYAMTARAGGFGPQRAEYVASFAEGQRLAPQDFRNEMARTLLAREPRCVASAIGRMIPDAATRLELATALVATDPGYVAENMRVFAINAPEDRAAIAMAIVKQTGSKHLEVIRWRFDITSATVGAELDAAAVARDRELAGQKRA